MGDEHANRLRLPRRWNAEELLEKAEAEARLMRSDRDRLAKDAAFALQWYGRSRAALMELRDKLDDAEAGTLHLDLEHEVRILLDDLGV